MPLTREEEADLRRDIAESRGTVRGWTTAAAARLLATLDAEREQWDFLSAMRIQGHPFTCAYCVGPSRPEWTTVAEYADHMESVHPGLPHEPRFATVTVSRRPPVWIE